MAYSTSTDVQIACGGPARLVELADHDDDGAADAAVVASAITAADALIDSYLQKRHATPLSEPVPASIVRMSAEIAGYVLKRDRRALTDDDRDDHEVRLAWLRDVSKGIATPGPDPVPSASTNVRPAVLERSEDEDISRESLKGFW